MIEFSTHQAPATEQTPTSANPGNVLTGGTTRGAETFEVRQHRIEEQLTQSLALPDPRAAGLGSVGADLMQIELRVSEALTGAMGSGRLSFAELEQYQPAVNMLTKLAKTIAQLIQLQTKFDRTDDSGEAQPLPSEEIAS